MVAQSINHSWDVICLSQYLDNIFQGPILKDEAEDKALYIHDRQIHGAE